MSFKQQSGRGGGRRDQLKSMKEADPDGLNKAPIQQSMDKLQVPTNSLTASCKIKSMNDSENSGGLKPVRSLMKKNSGVGLHPTLNLNMATCSSAVKISRNPQSLDLDEPNRTSKSMLCSYKYCSLHGQKKHEASFPALKCFLSARRKNGSQDEVEIVNINSKNQSQESYSVTSFEDYADNNSEISVEHGTADEAAVPYLQKQSNYSQGFDESRAEADSKLLLEAEDVKEGHEILQIKTFSFSNVEDSAYGSLQSEVELLNQEAGSNVENDGSKINNYDKEGDSSDGLGIEKKNATNSASLSSENPLAELTNRPKARYSGTRKIIAENQEKKGSIASPRPPRFLPLKPEQEAEVVSLKHQTVEERKATEEWMIDYALRKTLRRMAPARKRKVALLVAAFESVIQQEQGTTVL